MKMIHRGCGGEVIESKTKLPYVSEKHGTNPVYECLQCQKEITGDAQIGFVPESESDKLMLESFADPVCLIHGKHWSENPPHWAGKCMFCCLCFKELKSTADCYSLPDGSYEDVCKECGESEAKNHESNSGRL